MDFVTCLKAYLRGEKIEYDGSKDILRIAYEQALSQILYPVFEISDFKSSYISSMISSKKMDDVMVEISDIFKENKIKHIFVKGSVFAKYYMDPVIRSRGDIDVYIEDGMINKAIEILEPYGYKLKREKDSIHHISVFKDEIEVELHFNLVDYDDDKKIRDLLNNPFLISNEKEPFLYELKMEYHILYAIWHFAHHLRYGAGIRYILDFYYLLKTELNFKLLNELINKYGFRKFYNNILNVIFYLSGERLDEFSDTDISYFIEYMLSHGVHGHHNNDGSMTSEVHKNKFKYFMSRALLLDRQYRKSRYKILGSHIILYPICLLKHLIIMFFTRLGSFFKFVFGKNKKKDIYKRLGIGA